MTATEFLECSIGFCALAIGLRQCVLALLEIS